MVAMEVEVVTSHPLLFVVNHVVQIVIVFLKVAVAEQSPAKAGNVLMLLAPMTLSPEQTASA